MKTQDRIIGEVLETEDYGKFRNVDGNRNLNEKHIKDLMASMQNKYIKAPITVTEHLEIADGQHRFEAARRLRYPIYYTIVKGLTLDDIQRLNAINLNWIWYDVLDSWANERIDQNYVKFWEIWDSAEYGNREFSISQIYDMFNKLGGKKLARKTFFDGEFKVRNIEKVISIISILRRISFVYSGYNRKGFILAMLHIVSIKGFELKRLITRLGRMELKHYGTHKDYLSRLEEIYNNKNPKKLYIRKLS